MLNKNPLKSVIIIHVKIQSKSKKKKKKLCSASTKFSSRNEGKYPNRDGA